MLVGAARWRLGPLHLPPVSRGGLALLATSGALGYALGGWLFLLGVARAGIAKTAILTSISPIFTVALSAWLLREPVTVRLIIGTCLCVSGVVLIVA
jgi:drug/metabolite transporter (DMT)-like permease